MSQCFGNYQNTFLSPSLSISLVESLTLIATLIVAVLSAKENPSGSGTAVVTSSSSFHNLLNQMCHSHVKAFSSLWLKAIFEFLTGGIDCVLDSTLPVSEDEMDGVTLFDKLGIALKFLPTDKVKPNPLLSNTINMNFLLAWTISVSLM